MELRNPFMKPLYTQRYFDAMNHVRMVKPAFFIDLGCAEAGFLFYASRHPDFLNFVVGVDNDSAVLRKVRYTFQSNILYRNSRPFRVAVVKEDVTSFSQEFINQYKNCPFVTSLELIEHLQPEDVDRAANELFGKLQPNHVYLTTPNIEYNPILLEVYGRQKYENFRHADHKFEWTRDEFRQWCESVCSRYGYSCEIGGIGNVMESGVDDGSVGCASHAVFFTRNEIVTKEYDIPTHCSYFTVVNVDAHENYLHGYTPQPTPEPSEPEYGPDSETDDEDL